MARESASVARTVSQYKRSCGEGDNEQPLVSGESSAMALMGTGRGCERVESVVLWNLRFGCVVLRMIC